MKVCIRLTPCSSHIIATGLRVQVTSIFCANSMSIRSQLICFTLVIILVVGVGISSYSIYSDNTRAYASYEQECIVTIDFLTASIANDVYFLDVKALELKLQEAFVHPSINSIVVYNIKGQGIASRSREGKELERIVKPDETVLQETVFPHIVKGETTWGVTSRIIFPDGTNLGYLLIKFSIQDIEKRVAESVKRQVIATVLALMGGAALAFFLATSLSRRINKILQGFQRVGEGDLNTQLHINSNDELGELADQFNKMTNRLARYWSDVNEARIKAEKANDAKSMFLANMSHEIRTPLNGLMGMAELLLATELRANQRRYANAIINSGDTLLNVINDILDFSKIEQGELIFENRWFDIRDVLEELAQLFAPRAYVKKLELLLSIADDLPQKYYGDSHRLKQVVSNFMNNAIKFTSSGEIEIEACVGDTVNGTPALSVFIRDTGIGVDEVTKNRLFTPFTQADESITRKYGGTGLGLAICKSIVETMGGSIIMESTVDIGTRIGFSVPLKSNERIPQFRIQNQLTNVRALVVDDNERVLEILSKQLSSWNIQNVTLTQGLDAIAEYKQSMNAGVAYDVVIIDQELSDINGVKLAEHIHSISKGIPPSLIILVPNWGDSDSILANGNITLHCLAKPVRVKELQRALLAGSQDELPQDRAEKHQGDSLKVFRNSLSGKILLVEDNLVNQEVAIGTLKLFGCDIEVADDGTEALTMWENNFYNLILMDLQMPRMDGYQATQEIRSREMSTGRHTPIIALTAHALKGEQSKCLEAGMDGYLPKPFDTVELHKTVKRWLTGEN